jgi:hypothetical protein
MISLLSPPLSPSLSFFSSLLKKYFEYIWFYITDIKEFIEQIQNFGDLSSGQKQVLNTILDILKNRENLAENSNELVVQQFVESVAI